MGAFKARGSRQCGHIGLGSSRPETSGQEKCSIGRCEQRQAHSILGGLFPCANDRPCLLVFNHADRKQLKSWTKDVIAPVFKAAEIERGSNMMSHRLCDTFAADHLATKSRRHCPTLQGDVDFQLFISCVAQSVDFPA